MLLSAGDKTRPRSQSKRRIDLTRRNSSNITVRDSKVPLSIMNRATRQQINKEIKDLNITLD